RSKDYLVDFFEQYTPSSLELLLNKGHHFMGRNNWEDALNAFEEVLESKSTHPEALLNNIRCLIALGRGEQAISVLRTFPASPEFNQAQEFFGIAVALTKHYSGQLQTEDELGSMYDRSLYLVTRGNIPAALDGLMTVLRENKNYLNGEVKNVT
ncbi:MAG: tetratricopeptide repeat protein, partial [candidate division Zixibacteria bacterium]|nr:tetratricopeptide repeat protein [candidate division Zixibacteria bacterium]NIS46783.1 tetratricopeptide repeat protein [candidate division Zixibacteria bacterium]NIU14918.1 tetratricopeptide repeat protein [candidate division Zixibacteria bacterium]NIV06929.1 tetratricopeptide repeat protein [candidate division Zixibacteria bacterium]NIW45778.1 tetratricopeptide repeat protein [Gammaproteobacteria bacterium]